MYAGYGISADFKILSRSWTFLADSLSSPQRVVDLQVLVKMVKAPTHTHTYRKMKRKYSTFFLQVEGLKLSALRKRTCYLPCHPLLQSHSSRSHCGEDEVKHSIPVHPLLQSTPHRNGNDNQNQTPNSTHSTCTAGVATKSKDSVASNSPYPYCNTTSSSLPPHSSLPSQVDSSVCPSDTTVNTPLAPTSSQSSGGTGNYDDMRVTASSDVDGGYSTATGLSLLVEKCLGKPLDKSQQLSDWERRPLKEKQVRYAGT